MDHFINNFQVPLIVQRKQVRRITIRVIWDGRIVISVPIGIDNEIIEEILRKRADWISEKLREYKTEKMLLSSLYKFVDGELFWVFGKPVVLKVINDKEEKVELKGKSLVVKITENSADKVKQLIIKWLQEQAQKIIFEKVEKFAKVLELKPERIEFKNWKSKWGVCDTRKGILKFNLRLAQLPESLVDYIVVHELAHLRYSKHDNKFRTLVSNIIPDWKIRNKELKKWVGVLMW